MPNWDWKVVPQFGGGIVLATNPLFLQDDQWTFADGWVPAKGSAEVAAPFGTSAFATLTAGHVITGIHADPTLYTPPATSAIGALVTAVTGTNAGQLWHVAGNGTATLIPEAAALPVDARLGVVSSVAYLNAEAIITWGWQFGGISTMGRWNGTATFNRISAGGGTRLGWDVLGSLTSHLVGGGGGLDPTLAAIPSMRAFGWSAANAPTVWTPAISNDADTGFLDDVAWGITAILPLSADMLGIFTRETIHALTPTGGIPAFTRKPVIQGIGCRPIGLSSPPSQALYGVLPGGCAFYAGNDLYTVMGGQPKPIGGTIFDYWKQNLSPVQAAGSVDFLKPFVWHAEQGRLIVPRPATTAATTELWHYEPDTEAWGRVVLTDRGTGTYRRLGFLPMIDGGANTTWRLLLSTTSTLYAEDPTFTVPPSAGFVDTKDFVFGAPAVTAYIDRIRIEWEPLSSTSDVLTVSAAIRTDLTPPGTVGTAGGNLTPIFTSLGTLTGGVSELPCRLRGKVFRFRFTNTSGAQRIRGFSIRWRPASDRKA